MVTTETWGRRELFRNDRWARLMIDTLYRYRGSAYLLHEFVVMPDHIHVLLTPRTSLEKAMQLIKGGFSYRAKKELGSNMEVWQKGFSDHRIRDAEDGEAHVVYIRENPVRKGLCERAEDFPYSSAHAGFELDAVPQGLKPGSLGMPNGAPEGAPLQNKTIGKVAEGAPVQNKIIDRVAEGAPLQNKIIDRVAEGAPVQNKIIGRVAEGAPLQNRDLTEAAPLQNKTIDGAHKGARFQSKIFSETLAARRPVTSANQYPSANKHKTAS